MAPHPACVTGPRHGVPCATITQTLPRILHSMQTLWVATAGRRCVQEGAHHLQELVLVHGTTAELEVDGDVRPDRARAIERADVLGGGVDGGHELLHVAEIPQRLDAAGGGTGADRDQVARGASYGMDALGVVRGGDRSLDQ